MISLTTMKKGCCSMINNVQKTENRILQKEDYSYYSSSQEPTGVDSGISSFPTKMNSFFLP